MTEEMKDVPAEEPTIRDKIVKELYFEQEAYSLMSSFSMQLGWTEDRFKHALESINIDSLKDQFVEIILKTYDEEAGELEALLEGVIKLNGVVREGLMLIPASMDKYIKENNLVPTAEKPPKEVIH